jgi:F0F1-type ATP synthase membrane subunit b/b'
MAKLDLIPDVQVMIMQGALFGIAAALVKTQFINPYLKLRDKRTSLTEGNKQAADSILLQCDQKVTQIQARIKDALTKAQDNKLKKKDAATQQQKAIVSAAETSAKAEVRKVESEVKNELERELQRQPAVVAKLTNELYTIAIS